LIYVPGRGLGFASPLVIPLESERSWKRVEPQPLLASGSGNLIVKVEDEDDPAVIAYFKYLDPASPRGCMYSLGIERVAYLLAAGASQLTTIAANAPLDPVHLNALRNNMPPRYRAQYPVPFSDRRERALARVGGIADDALEQAVASVPTDYITSDEATLTVALL